ncbi:MAG: ABC transporter permease [Thermomicrobiales bacterium]
MGRFLVRRLLVSGFTLILISMVVYAILALAPGDPLGELATNPNVPAEVRLRLREQLGIDDPIHEQYVKWATQYLQGNWGQSFVSKASTRELIFDRLPWTLKISGSALILSLLIAIPVGVIAAIKQYSVFDQVSTTMAFIGFSVPTFFSGLLMIVIFSVKLGWLPSITNPSAEGWAAVKQSIMPIMVLGFFGAASTMRFVRASMLEVINQDYIRTARAKGLKERTITIAHAMRNALIPVVTIVALQIPAVFGGAVITEQIFGIPGIGGLLISSIRFGDTPVVMAITFGISILVVLFNILADVLYAILDPRIKLS